MYASSSSSKSLTRRPASQYFPALGESRHPMRFISVDFPEPEGPMMATYSPLRICRSIPLRACTCSAPISYTFVRASVLITIPELTKSSRYESVAVVSTGIRVSLATPASSALTLLIVLFFGRGIIYLHARFRLQRSERFVAPHNDLVTNLQALSDFDVGNASNSCFHRPEECFLAVYNENALYLVLLRIARRSRWGSCQCHSRVALAFRILGRFFKVLARAHCQRLNRNGNYALLLRSLNLRCCRKPRTQIVRRIIKSHDHLKILRLLRAGRGLRRGEARAPQRRLRTNLRHFALEDFSGHGVDGYIRILPQLHVNDVRLVHFDFRGYHGHVRERHNEAAIRILHAHYHVVANALRQIAHDSINR